MKTERELLDLKKDVEDAKTEVAELTGQQKSLVKQLKEEWACKSSEEGDKRISALLAKKREIDQQIEDKSKLLEEKYNV